MGAFTRACGREVLTAAVQRLERDKGDRLEACSESCCCRQWDTLGGAACVDVQHGGLVRASLTAAPPRPCSLLRSRHAAGPALRARRRALPQPLPPRIWRRLGGALQQRAALLGHADAGVEPAGVGGAGAATARRCR